MNMSLASRFQFFLLKIFLLESLIIILEGDETGDLGGASMRPMTSKCRHLVVMISRSFMTIYSFN